LFLVNFNIL